MHLSRTQRPRNTRNRDSVSDRRSDLANTTDFRRGLRRSAPQTELDAIHTSGCVVVPSREVLLERLPQGGIVAEVGVAEGEFSRAILQRNRPRRLHLIDLWGTDRGIGAWRRFWWHEVTLPPQLSSVHAVQVPRSLPSSHSQDVLSGAELV
jgi:hypothetical protein